MPTPDDRTPQRFALADLKPDPKNARRHDQRNMSAITDSLKQWGQVEPLVIQASTRMVIGGNGRLEAMKALGWQHADVVQLPLTDKEAMALSIALNRSGEQATWDIGSLEKNLKELRGELDLTTLGFDDGELRRLLKADQPLPQMPVMPTAFNDDDEGDDEAEDQVSGQQPANPAAASLNGSASDPHPDEDFERAPSPVRQPRPVQLYFEGDDGQAFFEVVDLAAECLGTRGHAETVLAALRRVTGQAIFPGA